jgi:site-specific recombinase XerD
MAVRQRGASWQADVQHLGKRHRETFDTEAEALAWEHAAKAAIKRGHGTPTKAIPTTASTIATFVAGIETERWASEGSHQMRSCARRFVDHVGPALTVPEALTQDNVSAWVVKEARERKLSSATINKHLSAVSVLVKRAIASGLIPRKLDLSWRREDEARLRWFSEEEEALVLQTLRLWALDHWADFFEFLIDTGARTWTEAGRLRWIDVSDHPRMASFWATKNGSGRAVPLTERAWAAIQRHRAPTTPGPFAHLDKSDGRRVWDRLREHLPQLEDTVWYTCRHTFASRLVQRGANLYRVQKLMGHKSISQTERYAKLAPAQLIETVNLLEPRA